MKIAKNFALLTLYLLVSGCGLILDIACLASGTPRSVSEEDKSESQRNMEKMHKDMMIEPTGDADVDFVQGMIPHHQGAVDMAKIVLKEGKDPEIKKFAQDIIDAQEKEIIFMKDWLKKHGK